MITNALTVSIILASSTLTAGYGLGGYWLPAAGPLALGLLWMAGRRTRWVWIAWPLAGLLVLAAAVGALLGLNPLLLLIGLVAAISAWNLDGFARRMDSVDALEHEGVLKRRHLQRLLLVDGLGLLAGAVALIVRVRLTFGLAVVLGLAALIALSRVIRLFGRERD